MVLPNVWCTYGIRWCSLRCLKMAYLNEQLTNQAHRSKYLNFRILKDVVEVVPIQKPARLKSFGASDQKTKKTRKKTHKSNNQQMKWLLVLSPDCCSSSCRLLPFLMFTVCFVVLHVAFFFERLALTHSLFLFTGQVHGVVLWQGQR